VGSGDGHAVDVLAVLLQLAHTLLLLLFRQFLPGAFVPEAELVLLDLHCLVCQLWLHGSLEFGFGFVVLDLLFEPLVEVGDIEAALAFVLFFPFTVLKEFAIGILVHIVEPDEVLLLKL